MGGASGAFLKEMADISLGDGFPLALSTYLQSWAHPIVLGHKGPDGTPVTPTDAVQNAQTRFETNNPKIYDAIIKNNIEEIANKNFPDEAKMNLITAAFGTEKGRQLIAQFNKDGLDPSDPTRIKPGQVSVFNRALSQPIIDEIKRLDAKYPGQGLMRTVRNWAEMAYAKTVFPNQIRDLNDIQTRDHIGLSYNSETNHWGVYQLDQSPAAEFQRRRAEATTEILNSGTDSVKRLYAATGKGDPTVFLFNVLRMNGFDVKSPNTVGIPQMMLDALTKAREQNLPKPEEKK